MSTGIAARVRWTLVGLMLFTAPAFAQTVGLYWTSDGYVSGQGKIERADLNGGNRTELVNSGLWAPWSLAVNLGTGMMYWGDVNRGVIEEANLDGSNVSVLYSRSSGPIDDPAGMAMEMAGGYLYWTDFTLKTISRTNVDTGQTVILISNAGQLVLGLDLDVEGGWIYWVDALPIGRIRRARLNGTNASTLVTGLPNPRDIALDIDGGRMYWVDLEDGLHSARLDGTDQRQLDTRGTHNLAIDFVARKLYWTTRSGISRINLDGTGAELNIVSQTSPPLRAVNVVRDCNGNGVPDHEDILAGTSTDCNGNGQPDECDPPCQVDSDCADCHDCTVDTCNAGVCTHDWIAGCGACCTPHGECNEQSAGTCVGVNVAYQGDGAACQPDLCPRLVPATSEWALVVMLLVAVVAGTVVFSRSTPRTIRAVR